MDSLPYLAFYLGHLLLEEISVLLGSGTQSLVLEGACFLHCSLGKPLYSGIRAHLFSHFQDFGLLQRARIVQVCNGTQRQLSQPSATGTYFLNNEVPVRV